MPRLYKEQLIDDEGNVLSDEPVNESSDIFQDPAIRDDILNRVNADLKKQQTLPETNTNALQTPPPLPETPLQQPATTEEEDEESDTEETDTPLSTPMPSPVPAKPSAEDDFESAFNKYKTDTEKIRAEQSQYDTGLEEAESRSQMATGIAGALQAFGEGLAAITGGSAKPLQTGAEALRTSAQQGVESAKRKAGSLKERLMMAREPLETKSEEMKLRDAIEQRQKQKRLADPTSSESAAAQERAKQLFTLYASHAADKGSTGLEEQIRSIIPKLNQFSANDILDLNKQMQSLSSSSKENVQEKAERQTSMLEQKLKNQQELADLKYDRDIEKRATNMRSKATEKINEQITQAETLKERVPGFINNLKTALYSKDPKMAEKAAKIISEDNTILNYLTARTFESKGVFTDQDLQALSLLKGALTWEEQFSDWLSKGLTGTHTKKKLESMLEIMERNKNKFLNPGVSVRKAYAQEFRDIYLANGERFAIFDKYANDLESGKESNTTIPPTEQSEPAATEPALKEVTTSELSDIKNAMDKNAIQDGETFIIKTSTGFKKVKRKGDSYEVVSDVK